MQNIYGVIINIKVMLKSHLKAVLTIIINIHGLEGDTYTINIINYYEWFINMHCLDDDAVWCVWVLYESIAIFIIYQYYDKYLSLHNTGNNIQINN